MSITVIGRPFSTLFNNGEGKIRVVVCQCDECDEIFCTRNSKVSAQKSCGCKNGRQNQDIKADKEKTTTVNCDNCKIEFQKRTKDIKRTNGNYCSRNCAAIFNNKIRPKRKRINRCKQCFSGIYSNQVYCDICKPKTIKRMKSTEEIDWWVQPFDKTLKELQNTNTFKCNLYTAVRDRARRIGIALKFGSCCMCGYDLHFEVAHIKPVSGFPEESKLSEVNHPTNLAPLCPNCHWEFDNGYIPQDELLEKLEEYWELCEIKHNTSTP